MTDFVIVNGVPAPGDRVQVRVQTFGTNPTTVRARAWWGGPEPTEWAIVTTDDESSLQRAGGVGFSAYLSQDATNEPVQVALQEFSARPMP